MTRATTSETFTIKNRGDLGLFTRRWAPTAGAPIRAACLLVHGFSWHSEYFSTLGEQLARQGVLVQAFDLKGHGRSEDCIPGKRGYVKSFTDLVDDIEQQLSITGQAAAGKPLFIVGESMGGLLVLLLSLRRQPRECLRGMVLSAPVVAVSPAVLPPWPIVVVLRWLARFLPRLALPSSKIRDGHLEAFGDRELAFRSLKDPYVLFQPPTLSFLDGVLGATETLQQRLMDVTLPLLVLHGESDTRVELCYSKLLYQQATSPDKAFKTYPDAKHQLLQDQPAITTSVIAEITEWVLARS